MMNGTSTQAKIGNNPGAAWQVIAGYSATRNSQHLKLPELTSENFLLALPQPFSVFWLS
jgi:hypothetical protein